MDQIHENPPTDPTELLYKNMKQVKRRIQIHTNLRYFHHFDTEMTINQAPVHWCFVFSFFQFSIILINTRSVIRRIVNSYLSDSDFRTFESEFCHLCHIVVHLVYIFVCLNGCIQCRIIHFTTR